MSSPHSGSPGSQPFWQPWPQRQIYPFQASPGGRWRDASNRDVRGTVVRLARFLRGDVLGPGRSCNVQVLKAVVEGFPSESYSAERRQVLGRLLSRRSWVEHRGPERGHRLCRVVLIDNSTIKAGVCRGRRRNCRLCDIRTD